MNRPESWSQRAAGLLPAVPARMELLSQSLNGSIKAGLAAAAYRLKEGESVWLSAPIVSTEALGGFIHYSHQMRLEAISGHLRASWANRSTMLPRSDILVWTRASGHFSKCRKETELGAQWIRATAKQPLSLSKEGRILRTLFCQASGSLTHLCDYLEQHASPFLQIVDLTPFGIRENILELLEHLESYFPSVPILLLTTSTDNSVDVVLEKHRLKYPCWRQQIGDDTSWLGTESVSGKLRLIELPDQRLEMQLVEALTRCQSLKQKLEKYPGVSKKVLSPLHKVIRSLRGLVYPVSFHEQQMGHQRKGGIFPILPLSEWLDRVNRVSLPTGESEQLRDQVVDQLTAVIKLLQDSISGKQQALTQWLGKYVTDSDRCLILTSSEGEAKVLRDWLLGKAHQAFSEGYLTIVGVGSSRDIFHYLGAGRYDRALVVTPLWESDYWALSLAVEVDWLAYPRELLWQQRVAAQWSSSNVACPNGKLAWWQMESVEPIPKCPPGQDVRVECWSNCSGEYAQYNSVVCDIPEDPDWIAGLMTPMPEIPLRHNSSPTAGEVSVTTIMGEHYRFLSSQNVYVLDGREGHENLEILAAQDLEPGQQLVQLYDEADACHDLLETLLEYAVENSIEHQSLKAIAERWHSYADLALHSCGNLVNLHKELEKRGVQIGMPQLKNWLAHTVIGPNHSQTVVPVMAILSGLNLNENDIRSVITAQSRIKGLHSTMGKLLKRLALASSAGNTSVEGSAAALIDEQLLLDLIKVEVVQSVHRHPVLRQAQLPGSVEEMLRSCVENSGGRLIATNGAYNSARQSKFQDLVRVEGCLKLLNNELFEVYGTKKMTLKKALQAGEIHHIRFAGDTASVTKGQFDGYKRTYKNKKVDIGMHLGIGNSRDPNRCFRLHFHWDENDRQLVIHHAGRHLPTSQG